MRSLPIPPRVERLGNAAGTSLRVGNVKADERYVDVSSISVVCRLRSATAIGSISVESEIENSFTEMDERLLLTLAGQAAIAIETRTCF